MDLATIIGAISGIISILGLAYILGVWKRGVDYKIRDINRLLTQYPPKESGLMVKTLWDIYVVDALRNRPDLADHQSAYKLRKEGEDLIPSHLKAELCRISKDLVNVGNCNKGEAIPIAWLVVKYLGMEVISRMAEEKGFSVQESIAILSTFLENNMAKASQLR